MNGALRAAEQLRDFLNGIKRNKGLSESKLAALGQDGDYVEKCNNILSKADSQSINDLWREVQHLSQFFGGDYAQGIERRQLEKLSDDLHNALLELVISLRH